MLNGPWRKFRFDKAKKDFVRDKENPRLNFILSFIH